ncbi:hypothetical protein Slin15195_G028660 [Septoria linicola]|uniref:Uncharacterized protein n=1 Tax=Septoria linicola TaxID=215465 RepID=A0A9Q9EH53_9PEZI|nr:hypothetical protein Slin14017_G027700 [Septoria linicola]USW49547.1 hypothetical protein Slin15195_G028660 [Septoria linicola]
MESANDKRSKSPGRSVLTEYATRLDVATDTEVPSTEHAAAVSTAVPPVSNRIDRTIPQALITATSDSAVGSQTASTRQQATSRVTKATRAEIQQQAKRILQTFECIVREFKISNWPDVNADLLELFEMAADMLRNGGDLDTSWVVHRLDPELRTNALAMRHVLPLLPAYLRKGATADQIRLVKTGMEDWCRDLNCGKDSDST